MFEPKWIFENGQFVGIKWVAVDAQSESQEVQNEEEVIKQAS